MSEFEFKPGDVVALEVDGGPCPAKYRVIGRITVECIGGTQRFYSLRVFTGEERARLVTDMSLQDFEVVAYPSQEEIERRWIEAAAARARVKEAYKKAGVDRYDL